MGHYECNPLRTMDLSTPTPIDSAPVLDDNDLEEEESEGCSCAPVIVPAKKPKKPKQPKGAPPAMKRGPARPHRKVPDDVLATRVQKLQKRIDKSQVQLDVATRHIEGYHRELGFRKEDN